jgi:hypothetical protein
LAAVLPSLEASRSLQPQEDYDMGIRVECDWCREPITTGESYMTLAIDGKINGEDASGPARVFCGGRGRKGEESCGSRLLALLNGNPGGRVDMGMEWQLVDVGVVAESGDGRHHSSTPAPRPVSTDADLAEFFATISSSHQARTRNVLARAGLTTLDGIAATSDDDLMAVDGIGWILRTKLRRFIAARDAARETNVEPPSPGDVPAWLRRFIAARDAARETNVEPPSPGDVPA